MRSPFAPRGPFRSRTKAATAVVPPPAPAGITFGADTKVGQGRIATAEPNGTYGPFTVASGTITPNTSPIAAGSYTVGISTITVVADVVTVSGTAELVAIIADEAHINNKTIEYRRAATYDEIISYGAFDRSILTGSVTIRPCNEPGLIPPWQWFSVAGDAAGTYGNVILDGVHIFNGQYQQAHNFISPQRNHVPGQRGTLVSLGATSANIILRNCDIHSNLRPSKEGGLMISEITGIDCEGNGHRIENCRIHNIAQGIEMTGGGNVAEGNEIFDFYSDGIRIQTASGGWQVINNDIYDIIGLSKVLHQDIIQFTGGATDGAIRGNVAWPGDYANRVITTPAGLEAGDQQTQDVPTSANITLTEADHNGKVIRADVTGLTITLPANPTIGDNYWFRTYNSAFTLTVAPNTGQTHGDNLLPRTVDNNENHGTFAVYWDGTQWQTRYGLRAGIMNMTAGTVTLTPRFDRRTIAVDASAGNVVLTLPPVSSIEDGIGIFRLDSSPNTVTIQRDAADTFSDGFNTLTITQDRAYTVRNRGVANVWRVYEGNKGELQGIFGNGFNADSYSNITIDGNTMHANGSQLYRIERGFPGQQFQNNTFMRPIPPNVSGDGAITGLDGFFNLPTVVRFRGAAVGSFARRSVTMGQFVYNDGAPDAIANSHNIELNVNDPTALPTAHFNGTTQADYYPLNKDQALSMALAKVGGPLDGSGIGALGTTISNGYWDYATGAPNPGYVAPPDPVDPDPVDPTPASGFGLSLVPADVANAAWAAFGGWTKTITDGWLIAPAGALRADTNESSFTVSTTGTHTFVVDIRQTSGGAIDTVPCRAQQVSGTTTYGHTPSIVNTTGLVTANGATAAGSIDLGGGVWRFWWKDTLEAGQRALVEMPDSAEAATDFRNPAIFASDLTVAEITALT